MIMEIGMGVDFVDFGVVVKVEVGFGYGGELVVNVNVLEWVEFGCV